MFLFLQNQFVCDDRRPLTFTKGLTLYFVADAAKDYGIKKEELECYYQEIIRVEQHPEKISKDCDRKIKLVFMTS